MQTKKSTVVKTRGGQYVWVDTCYTLDAGWETMVFPCDERGNVTDWGDLDCSRYYTASSAMAGHEIVCQVWADVVVNDNYEIVGAVI